MIDTEKIINELELPKAVFESCGCEFTIDELNDTRCAVTIAGPHSTCPITDEYQEMVRTVLTNAAPNAEVVIEMKEV